MSSLVSFKVNGFGFRFVGRNWPTTKLIYVGMFNFVVRHPRWRIDHKYALYLILQSDPTSRFNTHVCIYMYFRHRKCRKYLHIFQLADQLKYLHNDHLQYIWSTPVSYISTASYIYIHTSKNFYSSLLVSLFKHF